MKILIVGATGKTGRSIVNGLLSFQAAVYEITALVRPASIQKPEHDVLRGRGVKVVTADLDGPEEDLVKLLHGIQVVISAIDPGALLCQIPLANAAKLAGVQRFVPCSFSTIAPPKGVLDLRDDKEDVLNHIKKIHLPYTVIDVGWWYHGVIPRLPSGRSDFALVVPGNKIAGDGRYPFVLTDVRDIGRYVARIIADPRTLNRMVLAYTEAVSQNHVFNLVEQISGEKLERNYISAEDLRASIDQCTDLDVYSVATKKWPLQYLYSQGIRGDNTPEYAKYLGYLDAKELYPDMSGIGLEAFFQEILEGRAVPLQI